MDKLQIGILLLCLFVLILLVLTFYLLVNALIKSLMLNIKNGSMDESLINDKDEILGIKKKNNILNIITTILSVFIICFTIGSLGYLFITKDKPVQSIPLLKTVESGSMSYKNDVNTYLDENHLDNQIALSDLILLEKMPEEDEINKYDIVLYKNSEGEMVLHRIISIMKTEKYGTYYIFKGDANPVSDGEAVSYDQMYGIYRNKHVAYVGDFVKFLKSPPGLICVFLIIIVTFIYPIIDKKFLKLKIKRLEELGYVK